MTACKDSLSGKKAVSATLAGVLAVGMVPAAAFAETAQADTTEGQGIELQAQTGPEAFAAGTIAVEDQAGNAVDTSKKGTETKPVELENTGDVQYLVPTTLTMEGVKDPIDLKTDKHVTVTYEQKGSSDTWSTVNKYAIKDAGTYRVKIVSAAVDNDGYQYTGTRYVYFNVKGAELTGVTLCENSKLDDTSFGYTGADIKVTAVKDGAVATTASVKIYKASDKKTAIVDSSTSGVATILAASANAGSYIANVEIGGKSVDVPFEIAALDLAKAAIVMNDGNLNTGVTPAQAAVNPSIKSVGELSTVAISKLDFQPATTTDFATAGTHKGTIALKSDSTITATDKANIINSAEVTYNVVDGAIEAGNCFYGTTALASSYKFSLNGTGTGYVKGSFDCDKIAVYKKGTTLASATDDDKLAAGTDYTVTVTDKKTGETVDAAATKTAGNYVVTVKALYTDEDTGHVYGNTWSTDVEVISGQFTGATVVATYKGDIVTTSNNIIAATYTGEDIAKDIAFTVTSGSGANKATLVEGTDYKVTIKQGGKEVDSIVDNGAYTVTVEGITYSGTDTITVNVSPINVTAVRVAGLVKVGDNKFLPGDGSTLEPSYEYKTGEKDAKGDDIWAELPEDVYTVVSTEYKAEQNKGYKAAKEIAKAGYYKVTLKHNDKDVKGNYNIAQAGVATEFEVNEGKYFTDVLPGDWFYNEVYKAKNKDYVHGIGDTKMYAPYDSMTRADVCMVLMRMAGGDPDFLGKGDDASYTDITYETGFNDVSSSAYYAKAVQWAAKAGIVKGYGDTGSFGPTDAVTREQFATMLSRYAKAAAGDASSLDAYTDAAAVSDYAKGTIAWAVEAGVMGKDTDVLAPQKEVSRAEVAAMAVRLQPNGPTTL